MDGYGFAEPQWHGSVQARWHGRKRPVYLAEWIEYSTGQEAHDAFHTLADAKRWVLAAMDRRRAQWREETYGTDHVQTWTVVQTGD